MKYFYWKSEANGQWYWHLKAKNGRVIASGGGFNNKQNVKESIRLVRFWSWPASVSEKV